MKHKEIVATLAKKRDYTSAQASKMLETLTLLINETLANGKYVSIPNIGLFQTEKRDECITVDAKTNERHLMPPKIEAICIPAEPFVGQNTDSDEQKVIEQSILNIKDFAKLLAGKENISQGEAEIFIEIFSEEIPTLLNQEKTLTIKSFGSLMLTAQPSENNNPPKQRLIFEPDSALSELVNKPFSHFEPVLLNEGVSFEHMDVYEQTQEDLSKENEELPHEDSDKKDDIPLTSSLLSDISKQVKEIVEPQNEKHQKVDTRLEEKTLPPEKTPTPYPRPIKTQHNKSFRHKKINPSKRRTAMWVAIGTVAVAITTIFFSSSD